MAGDREREKQKKELHLRQIASAKARRRGAPDLERPAPSKPVKPVILIVCEGENTEPSYFRQFRLTSATIKTIGKGYNTVSLVNQASQIKEQGTFEQVWCVFDKDSNTAADFNHAIALAEQFGFGIAYSNQAFEYWLILHFEDHQGGGMSREEYNGKINHYINPLQARYDGNGSKLITSAFFDLLAGVEQFTGKGRTELAIERAKRNYAQLDHRSPALEESSTTVFRLVQEILTFT